MTADSQLRPDEADLDTRWLEPDEQRAWRSFITGVTALFEKLDRELRDAHGVSLAEYELMVRLSEASGHSLRMAELAASVSHSRSRTTHTISRMERAGIVSRGACSEDGRGVVAVLTDAGYRLLQEAARTHVEGVRRHLVDRAEPADFQAMGRVFDAVKASGTLPPYDDL